MERSTLGAMAPPLFMPETSPSPLRAMRSHFATPQAETPSEAPPEIQRVGREFEAMFLTEMLRPMFQGLKTDELGGGGMGEEMFRPLLIERYADAIAQNGGVGIADAVVRELMRHQAAEQIQPTEGDDGASG